MRHPTTSAGFTVVELLVVMAMIGLMAALFLPVLDKGKRNAEAIYDLNNNKQILAAAAMYAGENEDYLPQPGWGSTVACWAAGADVPPSRQPGTAANYPPTLRKQLEYFHRGQLFSYLKDEALLTCPADTPQNALFLKRSMYISSYVWNAAVIGFPVKPPPGKFPPTFRLRDFRPEAILQWEADENRPDSFDDFSNYPDQGISGRHGNAATVGRFDGGAQRLARGHYSDHAGAQAADFAHAGIGWKRSRVPAPNWLWCSPVHKGVPESAPGD
ncbi:MAG TPA: type II secretion system protein [Verrucomicrobiae bacterium]|jgi:prepilin-type N-terminal cleavage/methylation domain-containing protein|nr:type II secretion system protein [Verrucomicrobiae bacterium]